MVEIRQMFQTIGMLELLIYFWLELVGKRREQESQWGGMIVSLIYLYISGRYSVVRYVQENVSTIPQAAGRLAA